jgi:hypothetical protein
MTHYMSDTIQMGQDSSTNKEKEEVEKHMEMRKRVLQPPHLLPIVPILYLTCTLPIFLPFLPSLTPSIVST